MKKYLFGILLIGYITGSAGGSGYRYSAPDMETLHHFETHISDNIVRLSLPDGGYAYSEDDIKRVVDINDEQICGGGPGEHFGKIHWGWRSGKNEYGTLSIKFTINRNDHIAELGSSTLKDVYMARSKAFRKESPTSKNPPPRYKNSVQFKSNAPIWLPWDVPGFNGYEDTEIFIYPLDNEHYLRVQFDIIDSSNGNPDKQDWYAEAEDMVDQIMASITIDTGAEAATIEYGVPDLGLVQQGTLKYFDDISVR